MRHLKNRNMKNRKIDFSFPAMYNFFKEMGLVPGKVYDWRGLPVSFFISMTSYKYILSSAECLIIKEA